MPGGSYTAPYDGFYALTVKCNGSQNAWFMVDGHEFFGSNAGEVTSLFYLKRGTVITTRDVEKVSYYIRFVLR